MRVCVCVCMWCYRVSIESQCAVCVLLSVCVVQSEHSVTVRCVACVSAIMKCTLSHNEPSVIVCVCVCW